MDSGWARLGCATKFSETDAGYGNVLIKIVSGKFANSYVGGNWDKGIGAYNWDESGNMKWVHNGLMSQSGSTKGFLMVCDESQARFWFYHLGGKFKSAVVEKREL